MAGTPGRQNRHRARRATFTSLPVGLGAVLIASLTATSGSAAPADLGSSAAPALAEIQSLDGSGNNVANPDWGRAGTPYSRVAPARYADGRSEPVDGPDPRYVSNRTFNDAQQNLFSERDVTQWGFVWGQFLDHTFAVREGVLPSDPQGERRNIPFDDDDPVEEFTNDLGVIGFIRSAPAPGTGVDNPRQQVNNNSSYIDALAVYGTTQQRLEWMREGPVDGDMSNNGASLLLPGGDLPRRDARGDPAAAPEMELVGRLLGRPDRAAVAGDVRANENFGLQATHTLFAREHNRIVAQLPDSLTEEEKFQIARRVVIAEQQYITYEEFLPALGVTLAPYHGYDPNVRTDLGNEFATVGYRAHSMVHGEFEPEAEADRYTPADLAAFEEIGIVVEREGDEIALEVPLNLAFANPDLLDRIGVDPLLKGLGLEAQYKNDEQIDNQLRSVLFQIPVPGNPDCLDGEELPECFDSVVDLGAIDIARAREHGIPSYNELRRAYGLAEKNSFTAITGEATEEFPPGTGVDDPASLDFVQLFDIDGAEIPLDSEEAESDAVVGVRETTAAARLKAIYRTVDNVDPFVGMIAEQHFPGRDFGELQLAIWKHEFEKLRDGDRFFYRQDPGLSEIRRQYGIDFRHTLAEVIAANTDIPLSELNPNVFFVADEVPAGSCEVGYETFTEWPGGFLSQVTITNVGDEPIRGWTLGWSFEGGERVTDLWNGIVVQGTTGRGGTNVATSNEHWNRGIGANGGSVQFGFVGAGEQAPPTPDRMTLNGTPCSVG